ncbi:hypothetical protein [Listeria newyorkensis]|uniref:Uncharacterized protein n=1 Tax=Listeria newyorkensis TaxID=1497681 RepID=A0A841Z2T6_9LIST|nr:hypothetical protein [Listeria newyorkensis]MBC1459056.1 hypothetical protein [Listeria newyorkensis]
MKVFVLFEPGTYADDCGIVYGVFRTKEEAEKHKQKKSGLTIEEHTMNEYDGKVIFH